MLSYEHMKILKDHEKVAFKKFLDKKQEVGVILGQNT